MVTAELDAISATLSSQMHDNFRLVEKRPNLYQVYAPFYFEDGDMLDIYVEPRENGYRISDFGQTLMRLSYTFDLNTDNKLRIFHGLLAENGVSYDEESGGIFVEARPESLYPSLMLLTQTISKVSRLDVLRREVVSGLFFEMLDEFIKEALLDFRPQLRTTPIPGRDDLEVTCEFVLQPRPVYLMAVSGSSNSRLAALTFVEFHNAKLPFRGYVVHDDFDKLPSKDRKRITSAADKQFVSIDDFRDNAADVLRRDAA